MKRLVNLQIACLGLRLSSCRNLELAELRLRSNIHSSLAPQTSHYFLRQAWSFYFCTPGTALTKQNKKSVYSRCYTRRRGAEKAKKETEAKYVTALVRNERVACGACLAERIALPSVFRRKIVRRHLLFPCP